MTTRARTAAPTSWRSTPMARTNGSTRRASATPSAWQSIPQTGQLWCSVNERDGLGDDLVPDYVTHVEEGGFYGWPWYYLGSNQDPRHKGKHPELKDKVIVPDVLVQSHSASLCMTFYTGEQFPQEYRLDGFAAEHGSWNRARRTGYKVIRIPLKDGKATGEYEDFLVRAQQSRNRCLSGRADRRLVALAQSGNAGVEVAGPRLKTSYRSTEPSNSSRTKSRQSRRTRSSTWSGL